MSIHRILLFEQTEKYMSNYIPIRNVDFAAVKATPSDQRYAQELVGGQSGSQNCMVSYIVTPPGGGSPAGLHVHDVDQIFYVLAGTMSIEIDEVVHTATSGSLVVFPRGVPHRNWNDGSDATIHLAINAPTPDPGQPFARSL